MEITMKGSRRNQFCQVCGKKMKKCQCYESDKGKKWRLPLIAILILAILVILVGGGVLYKGYESRVRQENFHQVLAQYFDEKPADSWLIETVDIENGADELIEKSERIKAEIIESLERHRGLNDFTQQVFESFPDFRISFFLGGKSASIMTSRDFNKERFENQLEICFIPKDQSGGHPGDLYYKSEWGALMLVATEIPKSFFEAILWHEISHAYKHLIENSYSSIAPAESDAWIKEEIEFYQLEANILSQNTSGKFHDLIEKIIFREKAENFRELIMGLTLEDLKNFDHLFGAEKIGQRLASITSAAYIISLGIHYIDLEVPKAERAKTKIDLYRWCTTIM